MHILQCLLTSLIATLASGVPASRILAVLKLVGFVFWERELTHQEGPGTNAAALKKELKRRASLCARLHVAAAVAIDLLNDHLPNPWPEGEGLTPNNIQIVRAEDGYISSGAYNLCFGPENDYHSEKNRVVADLCWNDPWKKRVFLAWWLEFSLRQAVREGNEKTFQKVVEKIFEFCRQWPATR